MTDEIIKSITQAEEQAAEIKRQAQEQAAKIIAEAEAKAAAHEQAEAEACKAYREAQMKSAIEDSERQYKETLRKNTEEAKAYCADILSQSMVSVNKIVGRINSGNR